MKAYRRIIIALIGMTFVIFGGALGFKYFEDLSFFDALWMTAITVLTVGYGDYFPVTHEGKVFALLIIPFGIGLVTYALGSFVVWMIEGILSEQVVKKRMEKEIQHLEGHIIVCGYGRVGRQVVAELIHEKVPIVVIDHDKEALELTEERIFDIEGDATLDEVLLKAGIKRASGLIATLPDDADNVFISLTAKGLNPDIQVVGRAERPESEAKLLRAGADKVINPSSIGGRRMAMSILKPISVEYVDTILQSNTDEYSVEEVNIQPDSILHERSLQESKIRETYGVTVVAIKRGDSIISNPLPDQRLLTDDLVIVFGTGDQLKRFEKATKSAVK